jgi:hypothetical protein
MWIDEVGDRACSIEGFREVNASTAEKSVWKGGSKRLRLHSARSTNNQTNNENHDKARKDASQAIPVRKGQRNDLTSVLLGVELLAPLARSMAGVWAKF